MIKYEIKLGPSGYSVYKWFGDVSVTRVKVFQTLKGAENWVRKHS